MKIIGHRGACGHEPENTLASFKKALELGVDMIELDVYSLKDGELVVIHDDKVDRTTNGTGYVADFIFEELRSLDAGNGEKIPLLGEVLDLINGQVPVNIELKGVGTAGHVAKLINRYRTEKRWPNDLFLVSSFNHVELAEFTRHMPAIKTGALIVGIPLTYAAFAQELGSVSVNLDAEFITREFVEDAHERNLEVFVFTVNDERDVRRLRDLGVDGIFSNFPDRARAYLA
ncbi:MAG TPA: glycerophosphodiester phosphodiesterase family protein [Candidatus Saccharimonadales bacterium]|nr:glycerophosphodiester phosphodiesterase family protein [Candidatus Saccharimonadales bacterium]